MLIGAATYSILFWGSLVVAGIGLLVQIARRDVARARGADRIPEAAIAGARTWPRTLLRLAPIACMVAGGGGAVALYEAESTVVIVHDVGDGGDLRAERVVYLGDVATSCERVSPGTRGGWVINRARRDVRVETIQYGSIGFGGGTPTPVPAGKCRQVGDIDFIGPDDPPPQELDVEGVDAQLNMAFRSWLTWDRS